MIPNQFSQLNFPQEKISKSKKSSLIGLIFLISFLLVGGTLGVLASRIWDPLWNPFRPSPQTVIKRLFTNQLLVKTYESKMNLNVKLLGPNQEEGNISLIGETKIDLRDPKNYKTENKTNASFFIQGMKFDVGYEERKLGEENYVKLTTLPTFLFQFLGIDPSLIKNKWIKFDTKSLLEFIKEYKISQSTSPEEIEKVEKEYEQAINLLEEKKEKENKAAAEFSEKIKEVVGKENILFIKQEFPDEVIDGKKVYHYLVRVNSEALVKILSSLKTLIEDKIPTNEGIDIETRIKELLAKIGDLEGEIWIGKKDYLLYKIKAEKTIQMKTFGESGTVSFKAELIFSNFDQPILIEKPTGYKELKELLLPFLEQFFFQMMKELPASTGTEFQFVPSSFPESSFPSQFPMLTPLFSGSLLDSFLGIFEK